MAYKIGGIDVHKRVLMVVESSPISFYSDDRVV